MALHSLTTKLMLAFLCVGLIGSLLVALLAGWQTQQQFDRFIFDLYEEQIAELTMELQSYYRQTGSWAGINTLAIREGRRGRACARAWQLVTLVNTDGRTVSSGVQYSRGEQVQPEALRKGVPIEVDGEPVGWLLFDALKQFAPPPGSPERAFLLNVEQATMWSAVAAAVLALGLGAALAHTISRPVRELTAATRAIARGELGRQVPVRTQDELGTLARSFNQMSTDLADAVAVRHQLTADVAHDLRTPLSSLLGYTEALSEGKFEGSPEIYRILHQETEHLQRLVEDLHTLSLADAGDLQLHPEPTPPRRLLERVVLAHNIQAEEQGITLALEAEEVLPPLQVDPERMAQVLGNLVGNALRYTPAGGEVRLRAAAADGSVYLIVRDTGSGISPEALPHIWDRLYQGDRTRSQKGSSGLGLTIARSIVEAHGGTITAESQPGEGATFTIAMPAART